MFFFSTKHLYNWSFPSRRLSVRPSPAWICIYGFFSFMLIFEVEQNLNIERVAKTYSKRQALEQALFAFGIFLPFITEYVGYSWSEYRAKYFASWNPVIIRPMYWCCVVRRRKELYMLWFTRLSGTQILGGCKLQSILLWKLINVAIVINKFFEAFHKVSFILSYIAG